VYAGGFLSDAKIAKYGRFNSPPPRVELEKIFFLDFTDRSHQDYASDLC